MTDLQKLQKRILHRTGMAIEKYKLIENGDRIMIAVSGGKDSLTMLQVLLALRDKAPVQFELFAFTLDQAQPGFETADLIEFYKKLNIEYVIEKEDTYSVVKSKIKEGDTYCSLCSRLRRGILYKKAKEFHANKIALGHHADDSMETLFMNMLYTGRMAAMPPALLNDEESCVVIRPLILNDESDIQKFSDLMKFPVIPCNLCGSQENLQRNRIKKWLHEEEKTNPLVKSSLKRAMANIQPRHLWDDSLMSFKFEQKIAEPQ